MPATDTIDLPPGVTADAAPEADANNGQQEVKDVAALALALADARGVHGFCDELGNPYLTIPDDPVDPVWPLHHQRVKAWFAAALHATQGLFVADRDLQPVLRVLEGRAWSAQRKPPIPDPAWRLVEREPVALALMTYVNRHGEYEGLTRVLFERLQQPDIQLRLQAVGMASKFPINTQVLSRRLKKLRPALMAVGLDVDLDHKDDGSHCKVRMLRPLFVPEPDGILVIPSGGVSGKNTGGGKGFSTPDATDGMPRTPSVNEPDYAAVLGQIRTLREGLS